MPLSRRAVVISGSALLAGSAAPAPVRLAAAAARRGIVFGAAIEPRPVETDPGFAALVAGQCALITAENALKWNALRPAPDRFDFGEADRTLAIARRIGAPMHGHTLVWHEAAPDWLGAELAAGGDARAILGRHIARVVGRYAGAIKSWDVINEPVERNDRRPDGLRRSIWLEAMGPGYLEFALRAAHAADPAARLVISDYGLEYDDESWMVEKRGTMLELLAGLVARRAPLHALGIQSHLLGDRPPAFGAGLRRFLAAVGKLGLQIHISELDVNDQKTPGDVPTRDRTVAGIYAAYLKAVLAEPAVTRVVTWGLSDRYTSKTTMFPRSDGAPVRPLPFDDALGPKPAARALLTAFSAR